MSCKGCGDWKDDSIHRCSQLPPQLSVMKLVHFLMNVLLTSYQISLCNLPWYQDEELIISFYGLIGFTRRIYEFIYCYS